MSPIKKLISQLSDDARVVTDIENYDSYCHDASVEYGRPSAIVFARTNTDIIATLEYCQTQNRSLVARGAGSGLSGGSVPEDGAVVLSLEEMRSLTIDSELKIAHAQAGVITKTIIDEAAESGLFYPPDPASYEESTIGGNVAENAGGLRCVKYGVTSDYILGLKAITSDGKCITTGIYNKTEGFNLTDCSIGSEGTLIIITDIALRLIDLPKSGATILTVFDQPENGAKTVTDIRQIGITPIVLEFLDGDAAACSNSYEKNDLFDKAAAILLLEIDPSDADQIETICHKNQCTYIQREIDPIKADSLWKIRRNLSKAVKEMAKVRISEDVAVPISKFPALVKFVAEMNQKSALRINSFGHAGDGNLHVNFLAKTDKEEERIEIEKQIVLLLKKTIELGGTLTGEHGIGLAKKKYLHFEFDEPTLEFMRKLKSVFDPTFKLNPGKIFDKHLINRS